MSIETFPQTTLGAAAAAVIDKIEPKRDPFASGVYFGLDEDVYHADPALGSTDMKRLARDARVFWWESRFNNLITSDEEEKDTEAQIVGRAFHAAVLEGRDALERKFAPTFYKGNLKEGKAERAVIESAGKTPIKFKYWERILIADKIIGDDENVGSAFKNTIGTEVSVFWVCPRSGIRKKARFDAVKPLCIGDLKTISNRDDKVFEELCLQQIGRYGYYTQAAHYLDAWSQVNGIVKSGAIFGGVSDAVIDRLRSASLNPITAFVFVFLQKEGAPLPYGTTLSPGNPLIDHGRADIEEAENNWRKAIERFGSTETPWIWSLPLDEADIDRVPAWAFRRY